MASGAPTRCRRRGAGATAATQSSIFAIADFLNLFLLSVSCPGVSVRCRWCSKVRLVVSVGPERLSVAGTTRDPGHHSRFAPRSSFWPPRHAALAPMALAAARRFIGLSPCPRAPGAPDGASADVACGVRASGRSRCTVCGIDALRARHFGLSPAAARGPPRETEAFRASSLLAGAS